MYIRKLLWTLCFYFSNSIKTQGGSVFLNQLSKCINEDLKMYQVMIVIEVQEDQNSKVGKIIGTLSKSIQIGSMINDLSSSEANFKLQESRSLKNPRDTTLFVAVHSPGANSNLSEVNDFLEFVIKISRTRSRPKCLIILLRKESYSYVDFLKYLWSKQFLDVSIVELVEESPRREGLFVIVRSETMLHYLNPFTNKYTMEKFSIKSKLFSDKLQNLHGYRLKAAAIDMHPTSYVKRNSTGYPISLEGSDMLIIDALAKSMKFTAGIILSLNATETFGEILCGKNYRVRGFQYKITYNEVQMFSVHGNMLDVCEPYRLETTRSTGRSTQVALVPLLVKKTYSYVIDWKFFGMILTALLFGFIMVLSWILKFEKRIWNLLNLIQVLFGVSIAEQPQKITERITFGCLIIICFFYSNAIYTMLMDLILTTESERKLDNFNDLAKSGLEIQTHGFLYRQLMPFNEGVAQKLLNDSIKYLDHLGDQRCTDLLVKYQNVSCIMSDNIAKMLIEKHRDECGRPVMKILKDVFAESVISMPLEPNSPYIKRFNGILIKLQEGGFFHKWREYSQKKSKIYSFTCKERTNDSMTLLIQLFNIVFVGYSLSTVAFFAELLVSKLIKFYTNFQIL